MLNQCEDIDRHTSQVKCVLNTGGTVNFTISQDKPDQLVVFGDYADGSAYVHLPLSSVGVDIYTGEYKAIGHDALGCFYSKQQ